MKELAEALKPLIAKLSDFLDILDLSFLISGSVTFGALLFALWSSDASLVEAFHKYFGILGFLFGAYVCGLAAFAVGRWIRSCLPFKQRRKKIDEELEELLVAHGLRDQYPFDGYLEHKDQRGIWRLYVRFWAEMRGKLHPSASLSLLNRYWQLAATYDGLGFSVLLWGVVIGFWKLEPPSVESSVAWIWIIICIALMGVSYACFREAGRYFEYQMEEIVATIATHHESQPLS